MSAVEIALAVLLGLVVNEFTDVSPWIARKLVMWSATLRYGDTARAGIRAEELAAVINDRPGKLFKLGTGLRFASSALAVRLRRFLGGEPQPADSLLDTSRALFNEAEPSRLVARYLFPTERYRGEWKRHWISLAKGLGVITLYGVLGVWAAVTRTQPRYTPWVVTAVVVAAVAAAAWRFVLWYFARFVITNKRLMSTEGVLTRRVAMIPLLRVTDLRYVQSPLARVLNYGTFKLESASRRNAMRTIVDLPNPNELYLRLVEEMYEPQAVEARLDYLADEHRDEEAYELSDLDRALDGLAVGDPPNGAQTLPVQATDGEHAGDPPVTRAADAGNEVLLHLAELATRIGALAAAIEKLHAPTEADTLPRTPPSAPLRASDEWHP